jgi:FG-GAP-like repeat
MKVLLRSVIAVLGSAMVVLGLATPSFASGFRSPHYYPATGTSLYPVAVADFNKDGRLDVVAGSEDNQTVSILYGKKGGGFKPHVDHPGGSYPFWISVADFNHDHRPDIAVGEYDTPGTVSVLLSKHSGFRSLDTYHVGDDVYSMDVVDFNRDGNPDIATANYGSDSVSILLGRRNGTFHHGVTKSTDKRPEGIVASDLNHDGRPDLAVMNYRGGGNADVQVFKGKGNGKFGSPRRFRAGADDPDGMVAGQFTDDHQLDLAIPGCSNAPNKVYLLNGTRKGTFKAPRGFRNYAGSCSYLSGVADLNRDGRTDLATASGDGSGYVSVLYGRKHGKLSGYKLYPATGSSDNYSIAVGRLNGDRRPDLAVPDYDLPRVAVLYGK